MRATNIVLCLGLVLGLTACEQGRQRPGQKEANLGNEEASIRATDAQWLAAAKARDTDKAASFWSDDATILMPNSPPIVGKEAIRAYVAESFRSPDFSIGWTTDKVVVAASGDMAYATGTDQVTFRAAKQLVSSKNNGLVVWRKQKDGQWKAAVDIATPSAPPIPLPETGGSHQ